MNAIPVFKGLLERRSIGDNDYEDYFIETNIVAFNTRVLGMRSEIPCDKELFVGKHIYMLDTRPLLEAEFKRMCNMLKNMSRLDGYTVFVIRSSKKNDDKCSYHVVFPNPVSLNDFKSITKNLWEFADLLFYALGEKRNFWDIRITSKGRGSGDSPTLVVLYSQRDTAYIKRHISMAHWRILCLYLCGHGELGLTEYPETDKLIENEKHMNKLLIRYSVKT